jgi:hypothetical protein
VSPQARPYKALTVLDAEIERKDAIKPLRALDVHELSAMHFKPRQPLLAPWLHSQDLCMVFASRGIGKTHFALAVSYALATGGSFLRWKAEKPVKVLYIDGELPGDVMKNRLAMHCPSAEPAPGFLRIFTPDLPEMDGRGLPDLSTLEGQAEIDAMIEQDTALVVVDNLCAWCRTGRENEAESWHPIANWILSLRRRGLAVLLVHHAGKGGQQRGTSKREDLLDVVISLARPFDYDPQKGAAFVCEFTKARNLTGEDAASLEVELGGTEEQAAWTWRTAEDSTFERVISLYGDGFRQAEIASELGINKSNVSRHMKKAREMGLLKEPEKEVRHGAA